MDSPNKESSLEDDINEEKEPQFARNKEEINLLKTEVAQLKRKRDINDDTDAGDQEEEEEEETEKRSVLECGRCKNEKPIKSFQIKQSWKDKNGVAHPYIRTREMYHSCNSLDYSEKKKARTSK